jgi:hypothetical protein
LLLINVFPIHLQAQDTEFSEGESVTVSKGFFAFSDSLVIDSAQTAKFTVKPKTFKPNPTKAVIYSAIFPGLGQIYNRKYWKLPIVYGGFLGCAYAITWNGNQYNGYKKAYNEFTDNDDTTNAWKDYVYYTWRNKEEWSSEDINYVSRMLKSRKDFHRRNRDLSYIVTIGVYAICMVDAYVDAQLFDFDISPDLSLRVNPFILPHTVANSRSFGLQCSLTF